MNYYFAGSLATMLYAGSGNAPEEAKNKLKDYARKIFNLDFVMNKEYIENKHRMKKKAAENLQ